jgi:AAA domain
VLNHALCNQNGVNVSATVENINHFVEYARTLEGDEKGEVIAQLVTELCTHKIVRGAKEVPLTLEDILILAPYNLQVNLLKQVLPHGAQIGTVDKFQGQEAAVVLVSMTTSRGVDAPRGTEFLFNPNRFNVAVSRAQCLAVVVHGADLLDGAWTKIEDLRRLNLFAHAEAVALQGYDIAGFSRMISIVQIWGMIRRDGRTAMDA